jgi:hypothetical protein
MAKLRTQTTLVHSDKTEALTLAMPAYRKALRLAAVDAQKYADAAATIAGLGVTTAEVYTLADSMASDVARKLDTIKGMRSLSTGPLYEKAKEVEAEYRPTLTALTSAKDTLAKALGAYRVLLAEREREARQVAAAAMQAADTETVVEALTIAQDAVAPVEARATCQMRWVVARVCNADLLPDEYWCPDMNKLAAVAAAHPGNGDAPVVPGVTFELVAKMGIRR